MGEFDTDKFIIEIENRPAIWNTSSPLYANKNEKTKAWEEICNLFYKDFVLKENNEKSELCRTIQRKWKSLRDSFIREVNNQNNENKSGAGRSNRKKYIFFDQLLFLRATVKNRKSDSNLDDSEHDGAEKDVTASEEADPIISTRDSNQEFCPRPTSVNRKRGIAQIETAEMRLLNEMTNRLSEKRHEDSNQDLFDEDRQFLLSLVRDLKQIPEENKLDCKSDILMVLKKWRRTSQNVQPETERTTSHLRQQQTAGTNRAFQPIYSINYPSHVTPHITSTPQSTPSPLSDSQDTTYSQVLHVTDLF